MLAIQKILHPTDLSPLSECAFRLACSLARDHGAKLIILNVRLPDILFSDTPYVLPPDPQQLWETWQEELLRLQPPTPTIAVEHLLKEGDPATEILRTAEENGCGLIVMGTHGRTGVRRLLMGSVAEQVLRSSACPVLTVKAPSAITQSVPEATAQENPSYAGPSPLIQLVPGAGIDRRRQPCFTIEQRQLTNSPSD
jgi:nucleotide-binding universal stress UspA family protein